MNVGNIVDLEDALDKEWSWRKQEMMFIKLSVQGNPIMLRAGIALLCAHFEGFLKNGSMLYIKYVSKQKILYTNLIESFSVFALKGKFKECHDSEKVSVYSKLLKNHLNLLNKTFKVKNDELNQFIKIHSNPSTKIIKEILLTLGIETDIFDTKANYIDCGLLANRHRVVHGERIQIDWEEFVETFDIIISLIEEYKRVLITAAEQKSYLKECNCNHASNH